MGNTLRGLGRQRFVHIRLSDKEHKVVADAADISGLTISSWVRMILRKAAIADLNAAGRKVDL